MEKVLTIGLDRNAKKAVAEFVASTRKGAIVTHHRFAAHSLTRALKAAADAGLDVTGLTVCANGTAATRRAA